MYGTVIENGNMVKSNEPETACGKATENIEFCDKVERPRDLWIGLVYPEYWLVATRSIYFEAKRFEK